MSPAVHANGGHPCDYHDHRITTLEDRTAELEVQHGGLLGNTITEIARMREDVRAVRTTLQIVADRVAELHERSRVGPEPPAWEEGPDTGVMDRPALVASRDSIRSSAKRYRVQAIVAVIVAVAGAIAAVAQSLR